MSIVIDSTDAMAHFNMARTIAMLGIEVKTGMSHSSGSVLKVAQRHYGIQARTKANALEELKTLYRETYGREYGAQ